MPEDPDSLIRFSVSIHQTLLPVAQGALCDACHIAGTATIVERIPHHDEVRLWVTLPAIAYDDALHVLIGALPAAEFGAIRYLRPETQFASFKAAA
jgi:hypothetical protein